MRLIHYWRILCVIFYEFLTNFFGLRRKCRSNRRLDGKVTVITGANTGIGKDTAYQFSLRGAKVYIGCRDLTKGESAVSEIRLKNPKADISLIKLDLSSLASVRQFVKQLKERELVVDILVNNAGVMACPEWKTEDGFEMQFGTNYLGHFLLTLQLLPLLKNSSNARVVNVSACGHKMGEIHFNNINLLNGAYHPRVAYGQSKLANILFTRELAKRLTNKTNINAYSLNPGVIGTDLGRHAGNLHMKDNFFRRNFVMKPCMGAQTTLYCSLEESLDNESGFYYDNCRRVKCMTPEATDDEAARRLWELSCDLVKLEDEFKI